MDGVGRYHNGMKAELTARLRREARGEVERGERSIEDLAFGSDLSVTTLRRFLEDGELSTSAVMRLAIAMGMARRIEMRNQPSFGGAFASAPARPQVRYPG